MKPRDLPHTPDPQDSPVKDILKRHGASLHIKGARGSSHKAIAEELLAELDTEKNRSAVVQHNLNAILNQYQITAASLKNQQTAYDELMRKYTQKLLDLKNETNGNGDDTETEGA
jgi:hypothetical protein